MLRPAHPTFRATTKTANPSPSADLTQKNGHSGRGNSQRSQGLCGHGKMTRFMKFVLPVVIVGISTTEISSHCIAWVTKESTLDMQQKYHMAHYTGQIPNRAEFSRFSSYKTQHALWLSSGTLDISFITPIITDLPRRNQLYHTACMFHGI